MDIQTWNPFVRYARTEEAIILHGKLQAIDHRIFYCLSGHGTVQTDSRSYPFTAGTLLYLPAGTGYCFFPGDEPPMFYGANFDFYCGSTHLNTPIPPVSHRHFQTAQILEPEVLRDGGLFSGSFCLQNVFQLEDAFAELSREFAAHHLYYDARCSALLKDILIRTARLAAAKEDGISQSKADAIVQYIHRNYRQPLSNQDLAAQFGYHPNHLSALIRRYTGLTLHQYVLHYKMHMAVTLLQSTSMTVGETAEYIGMPDIKHFSKRFRQILGYPPSHYKVGS